MFRLSTEMPLTVVSGLAKFMTMEELQGRDVVVLCNLKPANMRSMWIIFNATLVLLYFQLCLTLRIFSYSQKRLQKNYALWVTYALPSTKEVC